MNEEIQKKFDDQNIKLDAIYKSVEKTRKYFLRIIWITVITLVLPIIGLFFAIPKFLAVYTDTFSTLGL